MKFLIGDIETYLEYFLLAIYSPEEEEWYYFEVNKWTNDLEDFLEFVEEYKDYYWVFYNGLRFDGQVLEYIIRESPNWNDKSRLEICSLIYQCANDTIHDSNYGVIPRFREENLSIKIIDPFENQHFSNKNRLVSLKRLMFEMDAENIEELPYEPRRVGLTYSEIQAIKSYCRNDTWELYRFFLITLGETEHPLYKGNNQLQLRQDIEEEFGIPCLNYSDSKIGDELIKKYYCQEKGINYRDLPKKGYFRKEIAIKDCIAKYVKFKTPQLKNFLNYISTKTLKLRDEFEETISFYGNTYVFMKGGLHTENKPEIFEASGDYQIIDWDVSSYYPAIIVNNKKYPYHLGREFLSGYRKLYERRLELKPLAKEDKRIAGIVAALKISVNSVFGKSSDMQSWMYDRQLTLFTTITGELSLMMLIEAYELAGIHVISANTDGTTILVNSKQLDKMEEVNNWWKSITGYELERTDYKKIIFSTVNDYIAIKTDGSLKAKGDFLVNLFLYQNKSARIVPIALQKYFVEGISVEDTIKNHDNIYDFCIRQKSSKDFHYEGIIGNDINVYNKLIRYYISNKGEKVYKVKNPTCLTRAPERAQVEAGEWLCKIVNYLPKSTTVESADINWNYYIDRAERIIKKINKSYVCKKDRQIGQLSLW